MARGFKRTGQGKIGEANERIREKWRKKEPPLQRKWLYRNETYDFCVRHSNYCAPITIFMKRAFVPPFEWWSIYRSLEILENVEHFKAFLCGRTPRAFSIFRYTVNFRKKEKKRNKRNMTIVTVKLRSNDVDIFLFWARKLKVKQYKEYTYVNFVRDYVQCLVKVCIRILSVYKTFCMWTGDQN